MSVCLSILLSCSVLLSLFLICLVISGSFTEVDFLFLSVCLPVYFSVVFCPPVIVFNLFSGLGQLNGGGRPPCFSVSVCLSIFLSCSVLLSLFLICLVVSGSLTAVDVLLCLFSFFSVCLPVYVFVSLPLFQSLSVSLF